MEADAIQLLNSRNIRLVTVELTDAEAILERTTLLSGGAYFQANSTANNYQNALTAAFSQIYSFLGEASFTNRRVQLLAKTDFTVTPVYPANGYFYVDWANSAVEVNFFVPISAVGFTVKVVDNQQIVYNVTKSNYLSWNGQYRVHTVEIPSVWKDISKFSIKTKFCFFLL